MTLETFFEKFNQFADAPDAVRNMRELVLELAVRGRLIAFGNADPSASDSSGPFLIPAHWRWSTLSEAADCRVSGKVSPSEIADTAWVLDLEDIDGTTGQVIHFAKFAERRSLSTKAAFEPGDVLYGKLRPYLNKVVLAENHGYCTTEIIPLRPAPFASPAFLRLYLRSQTFLRYAAAKNYGMKMPRLGTKDLESADIPLPPLAEQKRIVAKVDELMALCDRLEAQQRERGSRHAVLARAALARFADAPTPANLQLLFPPSYAISPADLRKSILTLAVQGRLVPQIPDEEPAEDLLAEIGSEKRRLNIRGELKPDKKAWLNSPTSPPHEIPESWCWVRLQDVFEISRGGSPRPAGDPRFFGGTIPWITVGEITKDSGKYLAETATGLTEEGAERSRFINPGDLLLTNSGATLGVPKVSLIRGCMNDGVAVLRQFHRFDLNDFGYLYLTQQTTAFRDVNQGMGQPNLNTPIIAGWYFPLPPLAEQRRIVAKVDELMALVDELEAQLAASRATAANLLSAVVSELTGTRQP